MGAVSGSRPVFATSRWAGGVEGALPQSVSQGKRKLWESGAIYFHPTSIWSRILFIFPCFKGNLSLETLFSRGQMANGSQVLVGPCGSPHLTIDGFSAGVPWSSDGSAPARERDLEPHRLATENRPNSSSPTRRTSESPEFAQIGVLNIKTTTRGTKPKKGAHESATFFVG